MIHQIDTRSSAPPRPTYAGLTVTFVPLAPAATSTLHDSPTTKDSLVPPRAPPSLPLKSCLKKTRTILPPTHERTAVEAESRLKAQNLMKLLWFRFLRGRKSAQKGKRTLDVWSRHALTQVCKTDGEREWLQTQKENALEYLRLEEVNLQVGQLGLRTLRLLGLLNDPLPPQYVTVDPREEMTEADLWRLHRPIQLTAEPGDFDRSSLHGYRSAIVRRMEAIDRRLSARKATPRTAPLQCKNQVDTSIN